MTMQLKDGVLKLGLHDLDHISEHSYSDGSKGFCKGLVIELDLIDKSLNDVKKIEINPDIFDVYRKGDD